MAANEDAVAAIRAHVNFDPLERVATESTSSWQRLPEFPAPEELLNGQATTIDVPAFPVDRPFQSKAHYLEALYKILRFEGIEGLRYSVNDFRCRPAMNDDQNTCVYTKVSTRLVPVPSHRHLVTSQLTASRCTSRAI